MLLGGANRQAVGAREVHHRDVEVVGGQAADAHGPSHGRTDMASVGYGGPDATHTSVTLRGHSNT